MQLKRIDLSSQRTMHVAVHIAIIHVAITPSLIPRSLYVSSMQGLRFVGLLFMKHSR